MTDKPWEPGKRRRRRIVNRTTWTVAGIVLLLGAYISSWGMTQWYFAYELTNPVPVPVGLHLSANEMCGVVYAPLRDYADSDLPGSRFLADFESWCWQNGFSDSYISWEEANTIPYWADL